MVGVVQCTHTKYFRIYGKMVKNLSIYRYTYNINKLKLDDIARNRKKNRFVIINTLDVLKVIVFALCVLKRKMCENQCLEDDDTTRNKNNIIEIYIDSTIQVKFVSYPSNPHKKKKKNHLNWNLILTILIFLMAIINITICDDNRYLFGFLFFL